MIKKIGLFVVLLMSFYASFSQKIERVEPPFWWSDMQNTTLQLMIYGKDIGLYQPTIANKTIEITGVIKTENPNYLFIDLNLEKATVGTFEILLKNSKKQLKYSYELKQRGHN
jgi:hypothetical protein